jgi:hypothetical protein
MYLLPGEGMVHWEKAAQKGQARFLFYLTFKEENTQEVSDNNRMDYNRRVVEEFRANGGVSKENSP